VPWTMLLMVLGVMVCAKGEVSSDRVTAKEAVREKYLEWVGAWGQKYAAKEAKFAAMQAGQEEKPKVRINQLATTSSRTIVVDKNGGGDVSSVQEAVNWVPQNNKQRAIIQINSGTYWFVNDMHN
jgi:pectin methylesterase-like acyl-CoA thioesterase